MGSSRFAAYCRLPHRPATSTRRANESRSALGAGALEDGTLKPRIKRVWRENFKAYGARKVWLQLNREGCSAARCAVARLMKAMGIAGIRRGRRTVTTRSDKAVARPPDAIRQNFKAARPNTLWVADPAYVATWRGFAYVAFVVDAFARRIVGWCVSNSLSAAIAPNALEQALHDRQVRPGNGLIHHRDRGAQCLSIRYTERLGEVGIIPSVGRAGNSYDNSLAETVIGLFKTEAVRRQGPWRNSNAVEYATLAWVDWFNNKRLLEPIDNRPPTEKEDEYYRQLEGSAMAA